MLCRSIVYQQLSGKAASTIMMRFLGLYDPAPLTPEALLGTTEDTLRGIGLSRQKITYLKDLATKVQDGALQLAMLPMHSDAEVLHQLMGVKGVCPTFYTRGSSGICGPFSINAAMSRDKYLIA